MRVHDVVQARLNGRRQQESRLETTNLWFLLCASLVIFLNKKVSIYVSVRIIWNDLNMCFNAWPYICLSQWTAGLVLLFYVHGAPVCRAITCRSTIEFVDHECWDRGVTETGRAAFFQYLSQYRMRENCTYETTLTCGTDKATSVM